MGNLAILGAGGLLGRSLMDNFGSIATGLYRGYENDNHPCYDVIINANGNSHKWKANSYPLCDFDDSVTSVYRSIEHLKTNLYIYISSVDAKRDNIYGFHKRIAEDIVKFHCPNYIILRCAALIGKGMTKGPLYDIVNSNKLYVTNESFLQFITVKEVAKIVRCLIASNTFNTTLNVGGIWSVTVKELQRLVGRDCKFDAKLHTEGYCSDVSDLVDLYPELKSSKEYVKDILKELVYNGR